MSRKGRRKQQVPVASPSGKSRAFGPAGNVDGEGESGHNREGWGLRHTEGQPHLAAQLQLSSSSLLPCTLGLPNPPGFLGKSKPKT